MNPEDRLSQMLNRARGEDRVTESNWNEFASSARRSVRIQTFRRRRPGGRVARRRGCRCVRDLLATLAPADDLPPAGPTETRNDDAQPLRPQRPVPTRYDRRPRQTKSRVAGFRKCGWSILRAKRCRGATRIEVTSSPMNCYEKCIMNSAWRPFGSPARYRGGSRNSDPRGNGA